MKIVGIKDARELKSKKTGKPIDLWMVFYVGSGYQVIGQEGKMQFVDPDMFDKALGSRQPKDLVGRECEMSWDSRGYLISFTVA